MSSPVLKALEENGWFATSTGHQMEFLDFARQLGVPAPSRVGGALVDELRPIPSSQTTRPSLSANHGIGAFPLHTDTAYWRIPARYLVLRATHETEEKRPTLLLDTRSLNWSESNRALLKRAVFVARNGRSSFLATILEASDRFVRLDRDCMLARSESASLALTLIKELIAQVPLREFYWTKNSTLVLDNWRVLHGRAARASTAMPERRCIQRILVTNPN